MKRIKIELTDIEAQELKLVLNEICTSDYAEDYHLIFRKIVKQIK